LALRRQHRNEAPRPLEARLEELLRGGVRPCVPTVTNALGLELALVPAGSFWMGSKPSEGGSTDEYPRHEVFLTRSFYAGIHPVTQEQYTKLMGENPSAYASSGSSADRVGQLETRRFPVDSVSWEEANEFCTRLSALPEEFAAGRVYRLPTEAEWEYTCRGAGVSTSAYCLGPVITNELANFDGNYPSPGMEKGTYLARPVPVGSYPCNALGLYDLHGNMWEWCLDYYSSRYPPGPRINPCGDETGISRIRRGGSWYNTATHLRSAYRSLGHPRQRHFQNGLRVFLWVEPGG
jgi:formylglycine-generating enzyme required for sulfatase activity